jgi:zinc transporter 1
MGLKTMRFGNEARLVCMFLLTASYFLVEIVVGYVSNSMALVADSFHMLSDVAALIIAFVAVLVSVPSLPLLSPTRTTVSRAYFALHETLHKFQ